VASRARGKAAVGVSYIAMNNGRNETQMDVTFVPPSRVIKIAVGALIRSSNIRAQT